MFFALVSSLVCYFNIVVKNNKEKRMDSLSSHNHQSDICASDMLHVLIPMEKK
jgi:hypothetical protein